MAKQQYNLDDRVLVDFFGDGENRTGEIDAIDFSKEDPEHPYRVWYDVPRMEPSWGNNDPIEIECEWVSEQALEHIAEIAD